MEKIVGSKKMNLIAIPVYLSAMSHSPCCFLPA